VTEAMHISPSAEVRKAIIGDSAVIRRAVDLADRFARTRMPVLLIGARGTGKDLFAQYIHDRSGRNGEFVDVNCGALPRDMIESLLFGHRRGAFTGAAEAHRGLVEQSDGGTIFLDELSHLTEEGQVKLLRVLESAEVRPLGEQRKRIVDLRVVAAVQDDFRERVDRGAFRSDLFDRLAGGVLILPTLVQRMEDVLPLAAYFAERHGRYLSDGATKVLLAYTWPGNVRELRVAIERAGCLADEAELRPAVVAQAIEIGAPVYGERVQALDGRVEERERLVALCVQHQGNARRVAEALAVGRSVLFKRLRRAGISLKRFRQST
jgi:transcriptional regulator with PAS, ATPase and Fis domain